jgi:hypothetical protein
MANELLEALQGWIAMRRVARIVSIPEGETSVQTAARMHGLTVADIEDWPEPDLPARPTAARRSHRRRAPLPGAPAEVAPTIQITYPFICITVASSLTTMATVS